MNYIYKNGAGWSSGDWTGIERTSTPGEWREIRPSYYEYCEYRLPCGDCARTGHPCHYYTQNYEITTSSITIKMGE